MVPVPSEADEEARRAHRERDDLIGARHSLLNKIDGILATLGIEGYRALRRDRRVQLADLRQPDGGPLPLAALARIERLLDRLELRFWPETAGGHQFPRTLEKAPFHRVAPPHGTPSRQCRACGSGLQIPPDTRLARRGVSRVRRKDRVNVCAWHDGPRDTGPSG